MSNFPFDRSNKEVNPILGDNSIIDISFCSLVTVKVNKEEELVALTTGSQV
jgi:hypothetical protein